MDDDDFKFFFFFFAAAYKKNKSSTSGLFRADSLECSGQSAMFCWQKGKRTRVHLIAMDPFL